jgi:hypothetical protein
MTQAVDVQHPGLWRRVHAKAKGEVSAAGPEAYRRAGLGMFQEPEATSQLRARLAADKVDPWQTPPRARRTDAAAPASAPRSSVRKRDDAGGERSARV